MIPDMTLFEFNGEAYAVRKAGHFWVSGARLTDDNDDVILYVMRHRFDLKRKIDVLMAWLIAYKCVVENHVMTIKECHDVEGAIEIGDIDLHMDYIRALDYRDYGRYLERLQVI